MQVLRIREQVSGKIAASLRSVSDYQTSRQDFDRTTEREHEGRERGYGLCLAPSSEGFGDAGARTETRRVESDRTSTLGSCIDRGIVRIDTGTTILVQAIPTEETRETIDGTSDNCIAKIEASRNHTRRNGLGGNHR
jgi:hypothetical protein